MAVKKIEIRPKGSGDYGDVLYPKTSTDMVVDLATGKTVSELFTSVSNGKNQLETSITDRNGVVSKIGSVATFDELDSGIRSIPEGVKIKSIQRGSITLNSLSQDVSIAAVNTNSSIVKISNWATNGGKNGNHSVSAEIINSTTIKFSRLESQYDTIVYWVIIEFESSSVKTKQTGSVLIGAVSNISVSSINVNNSLLFVSYTDSGTADGLSLNTTAYEIMDSNTLFFKTRISGKITVYWQLIEFF